MYLLREGIKLIIRMLYIAILLVIASIIVFFRFVFYVEQESQGNHQWMVDKSKLVYRR